jgi:hypothetical protein
VHLGKYTTVGRTKKTPDGAVAVEKADFMQNRRLTRSVVRRLEHIDFALTGLSTG